MLSLVGHLAHACKVIPRRTFLQRMISVAESRPHLDSWICLNKDFHSDLFWWHCFLDKWNGTSLLHSHIYTGPADHIFTKWGCGATWKEVAEWSKEWVDINIATKELVPIVLAIAVWAVALKTRSVPFGQHGRDLASSPGYILPVFSVAQEKWEGLGDNITCRTSRSRHI